MQATRGAFNSRCEAQAGRGARLNQKVLWPLLHTLVPLVHGAALRSMRPVGGCLPPLQGASLESIELRAGGMIMEEWPRTRTVATSAASAAAVVRTSMRFELGSN